MIVARQNSVVARPALGAVGTPAAGDSVSTPKLWLRSLGLHITLAGFHLSMLEHCPSDLAQLCTLRGRVVEKRRNEFVMGRAAARLALTGSGLPNPLPVAQRAGGDPDWPAGIIGSITHCGPWAFAAVARSAYVRALGIDLEDVSAVAEREIAPTVCRASELRWVFESHERQLRTAMLFSAKESVYKAIYPQCLKFFDFHAAELTWNPQRNSFQGVLLTELGDEFPPGFCFEVRCQQWAQFVFTHAAIEATYFEKSSDVMPVTAAGNA